MSQSADLSVDLSFCGRGSGEPLIDEDGSLIHFGHNVRPASVGIIGFALQSLTAPMRSGSGGLYTYLWESLFISACRVVKK